MCSKIMQIVVLILLVLCVSIEPSLAGLRLDGSKFEKDVSPGEFVEHKMLVSYIGDLGTDKPLNIKIDAMGLGQNENGGFELLDQKEDMTDYSATNFIKLSKKSLELEPGWDEEVIAEIRVPSDIGDGSKYAVIRFAAIDNKSENVSLIWGILVPIYLTNNNSRLMRAGELTDVNITWPNSTLILKNTGNTHYKPNIIVTLMNSSDKEIASMQTATVVPILPGHEKIYQIFFDLDKALQPGKYKISFEAKLKDGTILDQITEIFEI